MPIATQRIEILEAAVRHDNYNVTCHMNVTPMTAMSMKIMMINIDI